MSYAYTMEEVSENIEVVDGIYKLSLKGAFNVKPGQFYMVKGWGREPLLGRPISIHEVEKDRITFLYAVIGKGTELLSKVNVGEKIEVLGPLGNGFEINEIKGRVAVVAGGIGIAPLVHLIKSLKDCDIDLYAGFRDKSYSVDNVEKNVNNLFLSTETGAEGHKGYVTDLLNPEKYEMVLSCGPEIMMKKVVQMCKSSNTPVYISMEKHMACGIGACLVCTCKTKSGNKRTCKDGPVFSGEEVCFDE